MDQLIEHALTLASQPATPLIAPIKDRIAYVVSHGQSYASNGYAIRTQGVAKALHEHGFDTLCFVRPGRPWELGATTQPESTIDGVRYIHSRWNTVAPASEKAHLEQSVQRFIELFRVYRPQVVLAASNYIVGLPAWIAARRLDLPFYNEVRGFWELSRDAREPGYAKTSEFKAEALRDTFVAMQAEKVFTLNSLMKNELTKRGISAGNIEIIPNAVSSIPEIKHQSDSLKTSLNIQSNEKVVGYIGSTNAYEGLDLLMEACSTLIDQGQKLKLMIVGNTEAATSSKSKTFSEYPWVISTGRIDHEKIADYYALCSLVVIPRKKLPVCELVPPMKAAETLAHQRPLLVSDVAPLAELAQEHSNIATFKADNSESLANKIKDCLESSNLQAMDISKLTFSSQTKALLTLSNFPAHTKTSVKQIRVGKQASIDISKADYNTASQLFYKEGNIKDTLDILDNLIKKGIKFDKPKRDFHAFVKGLANLQQGWKLPPRQPNAGLLTKRKHLLYCLHQSVPHATNGYSTRSHGIATGLQNAGWKVNATTRTGFPWDANIKVSGKGYHIEQVDGITYTACAGWNLNKTPLDLYLAEAADHFLREAQTSGAEVIVAASNHITALPALMAARRLGLPFVYEVRGLWEVTQASTQPEWMDSDRYHLMKALEAQTAREADLVITLTQELADELISRGTNPEHIVIAPNAVDAERFAPRPADKEIASKLNLQAGVPVIGYAGSAVAYEGLELLLESLAELKKAAIPFHFVLVGDGKVIDTVKAKAKQLNIKNECRFTGRVPFNEVPRYLSCMDIMPVPRLSSAVTEMVSPLKPLEAMAMAKAVVLSDVSPHKTFAGNNERARMFAKDSLASLTSTLKELIASPQERERLGKAARAWIKQERTWNKVTSHYSQALETLQAETPSCATSKCLDQITLGLIADQFTTDTLASAVKVVTLSPENWRQELAHQPIDAMFVESAWKGNNGQWHRKVGHYSDEEFAPLQALLEHCRNSGIPSLFWNKEDPVHFDRFRKAASLCDHVFTTDSRRIIPYLSTPGAFTQTASSSPFYASPKIHNLLPSTRPWQHTAAYGGTYYGKRYPERTEYMDKIMSAAAPLGLTIYDRQHDDPESPYKYPGGLGGHVAGSLSYEEMIQAYKAHPVQINVNSVLDSPTMFSRRVIETAACGAPLITGPALGMNRYLENAGHVVNTESEAAQALENLLNHPAYRWRNALKGARAVMRAHTTQHRLVQMLRTAGVVMLAPEPPAITLLTEEVTKAAAERLLAQTLRPQRILASQWQADTQAKLEAAGIACDSPQAQSAEAGSLWLLADPRALADLEPEDLEDLAWPTAYASQARIGFNRRPELAEGEWPGVALENHPIDAGLQLLRPNSGMPASDLTVWAAQQPALALRKPPQSHEQAPNVAPKKTVVIAGHDLKFIKPFYPYFTQAGIRLLLDFWTGHNQHNEIASKRLVRQADTVFCEWTLGNAIWYGKHKREGQKLVGRLHLQEIDHVLFPKIPFEAFDTVMFVGPHILRQGIAKNPVLKKNGVVVYNGVDVEGLQSVPRKPTNGKVLGFVGIVPQRKRFDLALDILRELRKEDDGYTLRIKGKRPEEYPWMTNRPEEMAWYETQYRRLEEDPILKGAVIFDPHGNDMPEWYAGIDFALSTSDFESFHFTIADGAASGCTPIILPWEGADEIYPKEWVYADAKAAAEGIKAGPGNQASLKAFAIEKFDIAAVMNELTFVIMG
ncbi:glycosyltransferase [Oceanimonas sp. CAM02]|uniref:glycosyltransferase n=1 Tax=Oceanimonas sp. CAM02 TaxID=3080336 RepID=UPI002935A281|nr:glycosyltransferase [Oceanimonas sp. CAM02]MDV2857239.1 glycosyltransferase [Oceanimonas sp. CAM02]